MRCLRPALWALILLGTSSAALAQSTGIGKYAGEFMATGIGGRALAMGGAYAGVADDVTAGYWNPAGLMQLGYPEIGLMHEQRFGGLLTSNYGAVAWPFGRNNTVALTVTRLGIDDIPDTRNALIDLNGNGQLDPNERLDYNKITMFNAADWAAYLSYAFRSSDKLALGVNLKFVRRDLAEASANGIGFDAGALYRVDERLTLGATVQDVTTTLIAWSTGTNDLVSPTAKIGASYKLDILGGTVMPAVDLDIMAENRQTASLVNLGPVSVSPRIGLEYGFRNLFALRVGYNDAQNLSFGAGIHLPKLHLDYAFGQNPLASESFKEPSHRISIRLTLEEKKFARGE